MGKFGRDYHFDEAKAADYLNLHATAPNFAAWIAEEDGQLLGGLGAYMTDTFFGNDRLAYDDSLFVLPTAQNKGIGKLLINAYVDWAREQGCKAAHITVTSGIDEQQSTQKILSLGFEHLGYLTRKTLED